MSTGDGLTTCPYCDLRVKYEDQIKINEDLKNELENCQDSRRDYPTAAMAIAMNNANAEELRRVKQELRELTEKHELIEKELDRNNMAQTHNREFVVELGNVSFWYSMFLTNDQHYSMIGRSLAESLGVDYMKFSMNQLLSMVDEIAKKKKPKTYFNTYKEWREYQDERDNIIEHRPWISTMTCCPTLGRNVFAKKPDGKVVVAYNTTFAIGGSWRDSKTNKPIGPVESWKEMN